jgi:hypothetical protein
MGRPLHGREFLFNLNILSAIMPTIAPLEWFIATLISRGDIPAIYAPRMHPYL